MMVNTVFGIVAGLLMAFSKLAASYEMIIIGRFLVGFNSGQRFTSRQASGQRFTSHA